MLRLRPNKPCDAATPSRGFRMNRPFASGAQTDIPPCPITAEDMNHKYLDYNGDCTEPDNFYPMTAFNESGVVGHLIMRFTDAEKSILRFGFVIVDDSKRGIIICAITVANCNTVTPFLIIPPTVMSCGGINSRGTTRSSIIVEALLRKPCYNGSVILFQEVLLC